MREAAENVPAVIAMHLEELAVIDDAAQHVVHVVRLVRIVGHDVEQRFVAPIARIVAAPARRLAEVVRGNETEEIADLLQARDLRVAREVRDAGDRACVSAPPSASIVTSSCVTVFTTFGPVTNMYEVPRTMYTKSVMAGEYTAPPAHGPRIAEICGTTPEASVLRRKMSAYPPSETTPSWMRAPPESFRPIIGAPLRTARSITLQIFSACASESDPPKTVKSCEKT